MSLAPFAALLAVAAPTVTISVQTEPATLRAEVVTALEAELPADARLVEGRGDLVLRVRGVEGRVEFDIARDDGTGRQRRFFVSNDGVQPALRLGVRVVVERVAQALRLARAVPRPRETDEALPSSSPPLPRPVAPAADAGPSPGESLTGDHTAPSPPRGSRPDRTAPPRTSAPRRTPPVADPRLGEATAAVETSTATAGPSSRWFASASVGFLWWAQPGSPQLGAEIGLDYAWARWRLGLRGGIYGLGCCAIEVASRVQGELRVVLVAASLRRVFELADVLHASAFGELGLVIDTVDIDPVRFEGETIPESARRFSPAGRLGVAFSAILRPGLRVGVTGGLLIRANRMRVSLPQPFTQANPDVDAGLLAPTVALTLSGFFS